MERAQFHKVLWPTFHRRMFGFHDIARDNRRNVVRYASSTRFGKRSKRLFCLLSKFKGNRHVQSLRSQKERTGLCCSATANRELVGADSSTSTKMTPATIVS